MCSGPATWQRPVPVSTQCRRTSLVSCFSALFSTRSPGAKTPSSFRFWMVTSVWSAHRYLMNTPFIPAWRRVHWVLQLIATVIENSLVQIEHHCPCFLVMFSGAYHCRQPHAIDFCADGGIFH